MDFIKASQPLFTRRVEKSEPAAIIGVFLGAHASYAVCRDTRTTMNMEQVARAYFSLTIEKSNLNLDAVLTHNSMRYRVSCSDHAIFVSSEHVWPSAWLGPHSHEDLKPC